MCAGREGRAGELYLATMVSWGGGGRERDKTQEEKQTARTNYRKEPLKNNATIDCLDTRP